METGTRLKVSSDKLLKTGIESATLDYKAKGLSTTARRHLLAEMYLDLQISIFVLSLDLVTPFLFINLFAILLFPCFCEK